MFDVALAFAAGWHIINLFIVAAGHRFQKAGLAFVALHLFSFAAIYLN